MSFSVIIPSRNAANLVACVDQIRLFEGYGCRIIVVDDGLNLTEANNRSGAGCYFCDSGDCLKIPGVKPFIFARNVNLGIKAAGADDVILLNDDALLQSKSGFTWLSGKTQTGEYDIVSATTNLAGNPAQQRARG